ncbi:efflux RND transporter periplasmic adaptor subunit [Barnesiella viscericola]|uniref:efflux RND transporter periplasmic adaptor subunit n=1 Tax=Barnesiella viscericola TaxID=397865 RepID=UPI002356D96F|nr:efflux RND transporter periplasmic adaptor subunit [Barnesiella viscericola]
MKLTKNLIQPIAGAMLCILLFSCGGKNAQTGGMAREYAVMTLEPDSMEWYSNYPAAIKGKRDIEIRPNVSGFITELRVDEGSVVRKGQVLFVIDTVPYKAALKVAETNVEVARANAETARLTAENKRELQRRDIISEYDLQMAENSYASAKAQLAQAEAQLVNARNNDSYTRVTSPLDGVVGEIPFRVGSLVSPSSTTPLTTVSDNSEMYVYFSMTERQVLELAAQYGADNFLKKLPEVSLKLSDGSVYPLKGEIETISGIIDTQTGSSNMRATFANPHKLLRSGGSGVIMIPMKNNQALLVPQKATYEIQDKKFVYVLNNDSTVKSTEITVSSIDNGKDYMVLSGLKAGDRIVIEGVNTLKDGMKIQVAGAQAPAQEPAQAQSKQ